MSVTDPIVRLDPFGHLVYVVKRLVEILETRINSLESGGSGGGGIGGPGDSGISHHDLEDLADGDDHPQYFLNPGRPGEPLSIDGDLNVAGRTTSTNMTCSNAPSAPTDVVRLADMPILPISLSIPGVWRDANSGQSVNATLQLDVIGNMAFLSQKAIYTFSVSNNNLVDFLPTYPLLNYYFPTEDDVCCPIFVSWVGNPYVVALLSVQIPDNGGIVILSPVGAVPFAQGEVTIYPFTVSWRLSQ